MATEKKTAAEPLHHWVLDVYGFTRCQNCGRRAGDGPDRCSNPEGPGSGAAATEGLRAEIDGLKADNEELRRRLADAEIQPLHKRGK